jgi:tetratricopeptide (TPR) repeat protein
MPTTAEQLVMARHHRQAGDLLLAESYYRQVLQTDPGHPESLHFLGQLAYMKGDYDAAAALVRDALARAPEVAAWHADLGLAHQARGRAEEAATCYRQALRLNPDWADLHATLGGVLADMGRVDDAVRHCREAIRLRPDLPAGHNNLGNVLLRLGKTAEAAASYQQALRAKPDLAEAHNNLGNVWLEEGKIDDAVHCFRNALRLSPEYADAHKNLGLTLLKSGDFEAGFAYYERSVSISDRLKPKRFSQPEWDGRPLPGGTLLLHVEHGIGDTLLMIRYAPIIRRQGLRLILECQRSLIPLLSTCPGIEQLVARGESPLSFDVHAALFSLPRLLGTRVHNIPADVPYLFARDDLIRQWRDRLNGPARLKIGICWQGNPMPGVSEHRWFSLARFGTIARLPGVQLVSLQKGPGAEQLAACPFAVTQLGSDLDEANGAFMDTAAVMKDLDLVISPDTAVAHLAGAMGIPVWVLLTRVADWRWLIDREDSPWYPNVRLFRQENSGDWDSVFGRVAETVRRREWLISPSQ